MNAIILAGGKSTRFGSDKALFELNQKPMLINLIEKLKPHFNKIYVIGNKIKKEENMKDIIYLKDEIPNKGPLGGLYTGLKKSDSEYNYLQACDMPFVCKDYLEYIKKYIIEHKGYEAYIPEKDNYLEPFVGIYKKGIEEEILRLINLNRLNFDYLFEEVSIKIIKEKKIEVIADPRKIFFNINKKEDIFKYKRFEAK